MIDLYLLCGIERSVFMSQSKASGRKSVAGMGSIRKKEKVINGKAYTYYEARYTVGIDPGTGKQIQKSISGKTQREVARVYLKTPNAPGQRAFLRCAASFFLEIRQYSCEKMSCATQKSLAAGHIMSFQIHPRRLKEITTSIDTGTYLPAN